MLKITNDGRKLALDQRLADDSLPDDAAGKVSACVRNIFGVWDRTKEDRSTQLVFCDLSIPKSDGSFNVYDDVKAKLVALGVVISILSALAELESQQKSIAIKEGIRYRMQEGLYKFAVRNTIGYYRDYAGIIRIEPAEARIVEYIYECFLEGASPQEIAESLTSQGIRSPMGLESWRACTIRGILTNEKYCGDVLYQETYSKDYLTHQTAKNKDVLPQYFWENNHAAIIKKDVWLKVQDLLASGIYGRRGRPLSAMKKRFAVSRVKSGVLRGFMLLDMNWSKEERDLMIKTIENCEPDEQAERN